MPTRPHVRALHPLSVAVLATARSAPAPVAAADSTTDAARPLPAVADALPRDAAPMPLAFHVHALVAAVERGRALEAFEAFYADDVVMQENLDPPTVGKAANRERERAFASRIRAVHESRARLVLADGDRAVVHWVFDFTGADGVRLRFDQLWSASTRRATPPRRACARATG